MDKDNAIFTKTINLFYEFHKIGIIFDAPMN